MLAPELIRKIKRVHIRSRRLVNTLMAGSYRSVFRGSGIEFEEVREYTPGDDVKSIDWNVSARMGRPYVKLYREERELVIMLLVDMSASGLFGVRSRPKREAFLEMAAVLAFNAVLNNDKIGAVLFTDQVEKYIPPKKGSSHVWRVIREIISFEPRRRGTDLASAVDFLAKVSRKKTVCFMISDFWVHGYQKSLRQAARRHDIIAALISDPGDFQLPEAGFLEAQDLETGQRILMDCSDKRIRRLYEDRRRQSHAETLAELAGIGVDVLEMTTDDSAADALFAFFRRRERRLSQ